MTTETNQLAPRNAETLANYYSHANVGDFPGAMPFLSEDVQYTVSGNPAFQPFAGTWSGRDKVLDLFGRFGDLFWLVYMNETLTVTGPTEVFSFNDEQFKVQSTGIFYRLGVVHHITFNGDGLINSLSNIHDTYPADLAFAGQPAIAEPMLPGELPGQAPAAADAKALIESFLKDRASGADLGGYFGPMSHGLVPGNTAVLKFGGYWYGAEQMQKGLAAWNETLKLVDTSVEEILVDGNKVVAVVNDKVKPVGSNNVVDLYSVTLYQLADAKTIGRMTVCMDTLTLYKEITGS